MTFFLTATNADQDHEEVVRLRQQVFELSKDRTYEQMVQGDKIKSLNREVAELKIELEKSKKLYDIFAQRLTQVAEDYLEDSRRQKFSSPGVRSVENFAVSLGLKNPKGWIGK